MRIVQKDNQYVHEVVRRFRLFGRIIKKNINFENTSSVIIKKVQCKTKYQMSLSMRRINQFYEFINYFQYQNGHFNISSYILLRISIFMEQQAPNNSGKIIETVKKYTGLIDQNKAYEFAQKIKMLSNRKLQSNKFQDAQLMLTTAIQQVLIKKAVDINICHELIDQLISLYENQPKLWNLEKSQNFYRLMKIRNNERRFEYYVKLLKLLKNSPMSKHILTDLIHFYQENKQFTKAQSHVIELSVPQIMQFYEKWIQFASQQESAAIRCRLALLKGVFSQSFQQSYQILQGVNTQNPFYKFANYLIMATKGKNREAYNKIGSCYSQFLQRDEIYEKIYTAYGTYFFKIQQSSKGLGSLLSVFN